MKIPELTNNNITAYLKLDNYEDLEAQDQQMIDIVKEAAFAYIESETGLTSEEIEKKDDLTIAYLALCQDMYDNRVTGFDSGTKNMVQNNTVDSILSRHRVNLV